MICKLYLNKVTQKNNGLGSWFRRKTPSIVAQRYTVLGAYLVTSLMKDLFNQAPTKSLFLASLR